MAAKDKSAMKVSLSRSRFPTFLFLILVFIVVVLLYYCWNLASSNQVLLREMKILESGKLEMERRRSALESQIFEVENERRLAEEDLEKERSIRVENEGTAMEVSSELHGQLQVITEQLYTAQGNEKQYQAELEKLKKGVNSSSLDLQILKGKADELLKKYKETKENRSLLLEKVANLTAERDNFRKDIVQLKLELDQQKKSQDVKVLPSGKTVLNKTNDEKKVNDEGQSVSDDSDKDTKESEKDDDKKDDKLKESEKDDESNNDKNAETPKEEKEKESVEVKSPAPSRASANQNNASVSRNIPTNIKPDGNKSQIEETDKRNQGNPDNSEEVEKEAAKDEGNTEQPKEEENPEEDKDMDEKTTKDENEEDEKEKDESDDDLDEIGRTQRSTDFPANMRRPMQPLPGESLGKMTRNAQPAGNVEEIRNLEKYPMDPQGSMFRRSNPLGISTKLEEVRRRKDTEDQDQ